MGVIVDGFRWLTTWSNWGPDGEDIALRVGQHLWYSLIATLAAVAIGLPIGLAIGHTGRGKFVAANLAGLWRAIPTIGVVLLVFRWRPLSVWPVIAALVVLAVPSIVLNTVAGLESVPADVKDAATGMGLTSWQRLWRVEVPNALPLILAGVRLAANQVIATATVAGLVGLGTLGYFIVLASRVQDYVMMAGASIAIIVLVLLTEALFAVAQRVLVSPGVRERSRGRRPVRAGGAVPPIGATPLR